MLQRTDLSNEAIRLDAHCFTICFPTTARSRAARADAADRRAARGAHRSDGEMIPLDEQDRALWDRAQIAEGVALVGAALSQGTVGAYQLQAAIAAVHDRAASADETNWRANLSSVRHAVAHVRQSDGRAESRHRRGDGARPVGGTRRSSTRSTPIRGSPGTIGSTRFAATSTSVRAISPVLSSIFVAPPSARRVVRSGTI